MHIGTDRAEPCSVFAYSFFKDIDKLVSSYCDSFGYFDSIRVTYIVSMSNLLILRFITLLSLANLLAS